MNKAQMASNATDAEAFLKCIANRNRLMILCVLLEDRNKNQKGRRGHKGLSVGDLNDEVPLSQSALSQHLSVLRDAGLVHTERESQTIYYSLIDKRVKTLLPVIYQLFCN